MRQTRIQRISRSVIPTAIAAITGVVYLGQAMPAMAGDVIVTERFSRSHLNVFAGFGADVDQFTFDEETTSLTGPFNESASYEASVIVTDAGARAAGLVIRSESLTFDGSNLVEVRNVGSATGEAEHLYGVGGSSSANAINEMRIDFDVVNGPVDYRLLGNFLPDDNLSLIELWQIDPFPDRLFLLSSLLGDSGPFDASGTLDPGSYYLNVDMNINTFASTSNPFVSKAFDYDVTFLLGDAATAPRLQIEGDCPGQLTLTATNMAPSSNVGFVYALATGSFTIPSGVCGGTVLGLAAPVTLGGTTSADANGEATITVNVPAQACGLVHVQALDTTNCEPTNVVQLP